MSRATISSRGIAAGGRVNSHQVNASPCHRVHSSRSPVSGAARARTMGIMHIEIMPHITVRPATPADLPAVARLGVLLVRMHYEFDPLRFIPATPATERGYREFLGRQLADADIVVLVAERDGEVVGYTYAGLEGWDYMSLRAPAGVLHDILVDPDHRGHGAGRKLLEATIAELELRGAPRVVLSTAAQNDSAQRMFAAAGFRQTMIEMTREMSPTR